MFISQGMIVDASKTPQLTHTKSDSWMQTVDPHSCCLLGSLRSTRQGNHKSLKARVVVDQLRVPSQGWLFLFFLTRRGLRVWTRFYLPPLCPPFLPVLCCHAADSSSLIWLQASFLPPSYHFSAEVWHKCCQNEMDSCTEQRKIKNENEKKKQESWDATWPLGSASTLFLFRKKKKTNFLPCLPCPALYHHPIAPRGVSVWACATILACVPCWRGCVAHEILAWACMKVKLLLSRSLFFKASVMQSGWMEG